MLHFTADARISWLAYESRIGDSFAYTESIYRESLGSIQEGPNLVIFMTIKLLNRFTNLSLSLSLLFSRC